ncbi:MAG: thioredoxin domain-containing protein [Acidimicrobiales bacterium]
MTGGVWIVSYVLLWVAVIVLGVAVVALLRQIGVLHTRIAPMGVHFAGEGPELDEKAPPLPSVDYTAAEVTVLAFTSPSCEICAALHPGLERLARAEPGMALHTVDAEHDRDLFARFKVRSTPYLVAVDDDGVVRSRGVANTLDQAEEMLAEVRAGVIDLTEPAGSAAPSTTPSSQETAR